MSATFLAAIAAGHRYRSDRGSPEAWILGIAHHELQTLRRRERRQSKIAERLRGRDLLTPDATQEIDARIDAERLAPHLERALAALSEAERDAFLLVRIEGLSSDEAARVLGVSAVATRVRVSRARRRLRAAIDATPPESTDTMEAAR